MVPKSYRISYCSSTKKPQKIRFERTLLQFRAKFEGERLAPFTRPINHLFDLICSQYLTVELK